MNNTFKAFFLLIFIVFVFLFYLHSSSYASIQQAYELFNKGGYDEAERLCNEFLDSNKDAYQAYYLLGAINEARPGSEQRAIINYKKSISIYPSQLSAYQRLAHLYNVLGDTENSIHYCMQGLAVYPDDFSLNYNLGILYLIRRNEPLEAVKFLEAARRQRPEDERLIYILGITNIAIGNKAQALGNITELRELNNQYLANQMEEIMRSMEEGRGVDMPLIIQGDTVSGQSRQGAREPDSHADINGQQVKAKGAGEISIKTRFSKTGQK
jgi:tetratricopeptide (TPR) repeat protein